MSSTALPTHDDIVELLNDIQDLNLSGLVVYNPNRPVAEGGFGTVYKGTCRSSGVEKEKTVAVKQLRFFENASKQVVFTKTFIREIKAWSRLSHPNVLPLLGYTLNGDGENTLTIPALVSEWMDNGNILGFVQGNPDCNVPMLALGMASGLAYLHDEKVVHSDMKSANVLVSPQEEAVICDFGSAHVSHSLNSANKSSSVTNLRGTERWFAYELLALSQKYPICTKESDVWAYGMTVYELLTLDNPYAHKIEAQVSLSIIGKELPHGPPGYIEPGEPGYHEQLYDICKLCWEFEPEKRPTMAEISRRLTILATGPSDSKYSPGWKIFPRILLIEGDTEAQAFLIDRLKSFGCDVEVHPDDKIAERLNRVKYELILMDMVTPKQEALQAIVDIRKFDDTTPIIAMTNGASLNEVDNRYRRVMNGVLMKPLTIGKVVQMLEKHLGRLKAN